MTALLGLKTNGVESFAQFITVIFIFIFVLALTYFTTRFVGKYQKKQMHNNNIEVIETFKVTTNKFIQIIKTGDKYLVIAVGKDSITMLTELTEDQIDFTPLEVGSDLSFQEIFNKAKDIKGLIHKK